MSWLNWFWSRPVCPVDRSSRGWLERRWEWLIDEFGVEPARDRPLILPTSEFFPDHYEPSVESATVLFERVCAMMGLDSSGLSLQFFDGSQPLVWGDGTYGARQQYAAGFFVPGESQQCPEIWVCDQQLHDPLAMCATMAHELAHVHLLEHGRIDQSVPDHEPLTDLLTVFWGLGVITSNSVIRDHSPSHGSSAYGAMYAQGYLDMPMFGYALAMYARGRRDDPLAWVGQLRRDVRTPMRQTLRLFEREQADHL